MWFNIGPLLFFVAILSFGQAVRLLRPVWIEETLTGLLFHPRISFIFLFTLDNTSYETVSFHCYNVESILQLCVCSSENLIREVSLPPTPTPFHPKLDSLTPLSAKVVPSLSEVGPAESCRTRECGAFTVWSCAESKESHVLIAVLQNHFRRRELSGIFLTLT